MIGNRIRDRISFIACYRDTFQSKGSKRCEIVPTNLKALWNTVFSCFKGLSGSQRTRLEFEIVMCGVSADFVFCLSA